MLASLVIYTYANTLLSCKAGHCLLEAAPSGLQENFLASFVSCGGFPFGNTKISLTINHFQECNKIRNKPPNAGDIILNNMADEGNYSLHKKYVFILVQFQILLSELAGHHRHVGN